MWNTPFDESMLNGPVIIHCPDESLAQELMEILERNGVRWGLGERPTGDTMWRGKEEQTCYWVEGKRLSYGSKGHAERYSDKEYARHTKCTFYGGNTQDFDVANDDELRVFLGIGGGQ